MKYEITGITGTRNNETIKSLQSTGTSTPANEPYKIDNLIMPNSSPNSNQLTIHGFGYSISEGKFFNIFFTDFLNPPGYYEFFSTKDENSPPEKKSELPVSFSATRIVSP